MKNEFLAINCFAKQAGTKAYEITSWDNVRIHFFKSNNLLDKILQRDNLNRAYKRVKTNNGCPGVDGMTVRAAFYWLKKNKTKLLELLINGTYLPQPLFRKNIKKADGGMRKLGIPTVVDRIIQQAIAQQLSFIYEPLFSDGSYGYRPMRGAKMAIQRIKELSGQGYTYASVIDLMNYFDLIDHDILLKILSEKIHDKRVLDLICKFLRCGVVENGLLRVTVKGCPQGSPLSPVLANIYLNSFDYVMEQNNRHIIRYADDIVILSKSRKEATISLKSAKTYLANQLHLEINTEKSCVTSVYSTNKFHFLGFSMGKGKDGVYIRVTNQSLLKAKTKLKEIVLNGNYKTFSDLIKETDSYIHGWISYYRIAEMRDILRKWDEWLRCCLRMRIWNEWKLPMVRLSYLKMLGVSSKCALAYSTAQDSWKVARSPILTCTITNKVLMEAGYHSMLEYYNYIRA